jgi:uncharacterized protein (UPF0335 family)
MVFERKPPQNFAPINTEIARSTNDNTRRIRILEQSLESSRNRISSLEERMIEEMGDIKKWMDQLSIDIGEISKDFKTMRKEIIRINKELEKTARKNELKELESLLDLYNPIKSRFVTRDEVISILENQIKKV